MNPELPAISSSAYMSTAYTAISDALQQWDLNQIGAQQAAPLNDYQHPANALNALVFNHQHQAQPAPRARRTLSTQQQDEPSMTRRIVQIFIVDPHESVPLSDSLIYEGQPFLTDLTDQELFYDLDIKGLLTTHNDKRTVLQDKAVKDRVQYLEPARVRDLKMNVTLVAQF